MTSEQFAKHTDIECPNAATCGGLAGRWCHGDETKPCRERSERMIKEIVGAAFGDTINHPKHYNMGRIEPIDVIEDWSLNFCLGNAVKYIARSEHKGSKLEDLKKARWYLEREIARLESGK